VFGICVVESSLVHTIVQLLQAIQPSVTFSLDLKWFISGAVQQVWWQANHKRCSSNNSFESDNYPS